MSSKNLLWHKCSYFIFYFANLLFHFSLCLFKLTLMFFYTLLSLSSMYVDNIYVTYDVNAVLQYSNFIPKRYSNIKNHLKKYKSSSKTILFIMLMLIHPRVYFVCTILFFTLYILRYLNIFLF